MSNSFRLSRTERSPQERVQEAISSRRSPYSSAQSSLPQPRLARVRARMQASSSSGSKGLVR